MKIREFIRQVGISLFSVEQAGRVLGHKNLATQLSRWERAGELVRLKRGLYQVAGTQVNELVVANYLDKPSYVSLETVLNQAGVLPDIPAEVTSVGTGKPRKFATPRGVFAYHTLSTDLYGGYELVEDQGSGLVYQIARPEKALLDLLYIRRSTVVEDLRLEWKRLNTLLLRQMSSQYPRWVKRKVEQYV